MDDEFFDDPKTDEETKLYLLSRNPKKVRRSVYSSMRTVEKYGEKHKHSNITKYIPLEEYTPI